MIKTFSNKTLGKIIYFLLPIIFIVAIILYTQNRDDKLAKKHKYSLGTVYKIGAPADGGSVADFYYDVNEKRYSSSFAIGYDKIKIGDKFLIEFYPDNPNICGVLLDEKIEDTLKYIPPIDGWKEKPTK